MTTDEQRHPEEASYKLLLLLASEIRADQAELPKVTAAPGWTIEWLRPIPSGRSADPGQIEAQRDAAIAERDHLRELLGQLRLEYVSANNSRSDLLAELQTVERERDRALESVIGWATTPIQRLLDSYRSRLTPPRTIPATGNVTALRIREDVDGWRVRWRRANSATSSWERREVTGLTLEEACTAAVAQIDADL